MQQVPASGSEQLPLQQRPAVSRAQLDPLPRQQIPPLHEMPSQQSLSCWHALPILWQHWPCPQAPPEQQSASDSQAWPLPAQHDAPLQGSPLQQSVLLRHPSPAPEQPHLPFTQLPLQQSRSPAQSPTPQQPRS